MVRSLESLWSSALLANPPSTTSLLDNVKTAVDILGTLVTAAAVIVGGLWAYFNFVKGRTYRPRLEVEMQGEWRVIDGERWLHSRVRVKNIGASKVTLRQRGTGLQLSRLRTRDPASTRARWETLTVSEIFKEHQWIEPGETISDDVLLHLDVPDGQPVLCETRLVWQWNDKEGNIDVTSRRIIPAESKLGTARTV